MRWFRRREETRTLLRDAATAVEWWLEGKPVPTFPENTQLVLAACVDRTKEQERMVSEWSKM